MTQDLDNIDKEDFSEPIPKSEGSVVLFILSQLRPGMSLNRITLPTFVLDPRSVLEYVNGWMTHADVLRQVAPEEDPALRCLHVATWIVSGFHVVSNRPKKPYNSLLGEVCRTTLHKQDGTMAGTFIAEQVSHHPPVTAFCYTDRVGNSIIWGHSEQRSKFLGNSIAILLDHDGGRLNYECLSRGETYELNIPDMYARGILIGSLILEVCGNVRIHCPKTGVTTNIVFDAKPFFWGRYNNFHGSVSIPGNPNPTEVIKFEGRWSAYMKVTDLRTKKSWLSFDIRHIEPLNIVPPKPDEQSPYETQYVWKNITRYINENDIKSATEHKLAIEEKQRTERKYFQENKIDWEHQSFHFDENQKRYVPNDLNLTPYSPDEPPMSMPPPFHIPSLIQRATDEGIVPVMSEVQRLAEERVQVAKANQ